MIKSSDGGASWITTDLSAYASTLVDCYFVSPDSGFAVGGLGEFQNQTRALVLSTGDGAQTWQQRWLGTRTDEWGWKISFPTEDVGYISLETGNFANRFLKSTDGGVTWEEGFYGNGLGFREQAIGFVTPEIGWIGGSDEPARETLDGGNSWRSLSWGHLLNRIFMVNGELGYAVGNSVYKYSRVPIVTDAPIVEPTRTIAFLQQNQPNPFNPVTSIPYYLEDDKVIRLAVYNQKGELIKILVDQLERAGHHVVLWGGRDESGAELPSGVYFYRLQSNDFVEIRKMVMIR